MMTTEDLKNIGWKERCQADCYSPYDHSHNFTYGKNIIKICQKCNSEIKPVAQTYGTDFGSKKVYFSNVYRCGCGHQDMEHLYDGEPISYEKLGNFLAYLNRE